MANERNINSFADPNKCHLYEYVSKREIGTVNSVSDFNMTKLHSATLSFKSVNEAHGRAQSISSSTHLSVLSADPASRDSSINRKSLKAKRLTTLNLLYYLEESFIKADTHLLQKLDRICEELKSRKDLFESSLQFIKSRKVYGELYYWIPGYKVDNVFSLIKKLIPNFTKLYKRYFIEAVVLNHEYIDVQEFIKERFVGDWEQFNLMKNDMKLFSNLITLPFWMDMEYTVDMYMCGRSVPSLDDIYFTEKISQPSIGSSSLHNEKVIQEIVENSNKLIRFTDDVSGIVIPEVSFIDFNIDDRNFICSLSAYLGLVNRDKLFEKFWIDKNVIDSEWNIL